MSRRDPATLRRATVRICNALGEHRGQGLLLQIGEDESVVLTCHHVIAPIRPDDLHVAQPGPDGTLGEPRPAHYDSTYSCPRRDAVVLRGEFGGAGVRPRLYALDPDGYAGMLPKRAIGFTHMPTQTLDARVGTTTRLDLPVETPGAWPDPPDRYVIPHAFRLSDPTDARQGVSGSVVAYEGGVVGLAQSARPAGAGQERELYLVPLSAWSDGWPALARLVEPLIDERLDGAAATVRLARDLVVGLPSLDADRDPDLVIAAYKEAYVGRPVDARARVAFDASGGTLLVGRPMSGKTRLAFEILRGFPELLVVIPRQPSPPPEFEAAGLRGRELAVVIDDLHNSSNLQVQSLLWRRRLQDATGSRVRILATSRDGSDFRHLREHQQSLLQALAPESIVFLSSGEGNDGEDFSFADASELGEQLGLSRADVGQRFDGTPGSLVLELQGMTDRYLRLRDEQIGGIAGSRLLDSLKVLRDTGQNVFREARVRRVAEEVRGDGRVAAEAWEALQRRTREEGFGAFNERQEFETYLPYIERCVVFTPSRVESEQVLRILEEDGTGAELFNFSMVAPADMELVAMQRMEESADPETAALGARSLGLRLAHPDHGERFDDAEQAYRRAIASGQSPYAAEAAKALGELLVRRGRLSGAEWAFRQFRQLDDDDIPREFALQVAFQLGRILAQQGRPDEAAMPLRQASDSAHPIWAPRAALVLGSVLQQQGRPREAIDAYRQAAESEDLNTATRAALPLAALLQESGQLEAAAKSYRRAKESRDPEVVQAASLNLADVLTQLGRVDEAERALKDVIASKDEEFMPWAAVQLGFLMLQQNRFEEAEKAFSSAVQTGHREHAPNAAFNLAQLLVTYRAFRRSRTCVSKAIASKHPKIAPQAALALACVIWITALSLLLDKRFRRPSASMTPEPRVSQCSCSRTLEVSPGKTKAEG